MATGLLHLHNILRWVLLILLLASIIVALTGWQSGRPFKAGDKKIWLFTLISAHLNLLIGIYLVLLGPQYGILSVGIPEGVSVMKNSFYRFFLVEHPFLMVLAVVAITGGHAWAKKPIPDTKKYRKAFWWFLVALVLILAAVPWPGREVARPLFPGM